MAEACAAARDEIDALLWDRAVRNRAAEVAAESALVGARDSAALDGAELSLDVVRAGLDGSPVARAVAASLAVTTEVPRECGTWSRAPLQVLARLHTLAASGFTSPDGLGRPRSTDEVVDALHIGSTPPWPDVAPRLDALAGVLVTSTTAPAVLVAGIAHAEILALRPFTWGSGLVARAATRLTLAARGVDPDLLSCPEAGMLSLGRTSYVAALRGYASGEPAGVAEWLIWHAAAVGYGARVAREGGVSASEQGSER